jgi:hypothetical protein
MPTNPGAGALQFMYVGGNGVAVAANLRPLYTYLKDPSLFECPSDRGSEAWPAVNDNAYIAYGNSYAYPVSDLAGAGVGRVSGLKATSTNFSLPSRKAVVFEPGLNSANTPNSARTQWHAKTNASIIGFMDGHSDLVVSNYGTISANNAYY